MTWSEDSLHRWLGERPKPALLTGSQGHDAAVLTASGERRVLCTDQTIEHVHFETGADPAAVGHKAAARALSDLAATGAQPDALLLAVSAPATTDESWLRTVIEAVDGTGRSFGAALVGGDLACAEGARALTVTACGSLEGGRAAPGRDRAMVGDVVLVTGPLGGSSLGRHLTFEPRVAAGRLFFAEGVHALMDVSDGLALDLSRIARAAHVRIDLEYVPVHPDAERLARTSGRSAREHALFDGEDHELLATLPRSVWSSIQERVTPELAGWKVIGRVTEGAGLWFHPEVDEPGAELVRWAGEGGYLHGN